MFSIPVMYLWQPFNCIVPYLSQNIPIPDVLFRQVPQYRARLQLLPPRHPQPGLSRPLPWPVTLMMTTVICIRRGLTTLTGVDTADQRTTCSLVLITTTPLALLKVGIVFFLFYKPHSLHFHYKQVFFTRATV